MEKPRHLYDLEQIETAVRDACTELGSGTEGCVVRAAVAIGQAMERGKRLRYALWDEFNERDGFQSSDAAGDE